MISQIEIWRLRQEDSKKTQDQVNGVVLFCFYYEVVVISFLYVIGYL